MPEITLRHANGDTWTISLDEGDKVGSTLRQSRGKYSGGTFSGKTPAAALSMFKALVRSQKAAGFFDPKEKRKVTTPARKKAKVPFNRATWDAWWKGLSPRWKSVIKKAAGTNQLEKIAALTEFEAQEAGLRELAPLARLNELEVISLYGNEFSDLKPIAKLKKLRVLEIDNCTEVTDLAPLTALKNLTELNIGYTSVSALKPLLKLKRLERLHLAGIGHNFASWEKTLRELKRALPDCEISTAD